VKNNSLSLEAVASKSLYLINNLTFSPSSVSLEIEPPKTGGRINVQDIDSRPRCIQGYSMAMVKISVQVYYPQETPIYMVLRLQGHTKK